MGSVTRTGRCLETTSDRLVVDLWRVAPGVVPWLEDRPFFVRGVQGGILFYKDRGYYEVTLTGAGLGAVNEDGVDAKYWVGGMRIPKDDIWSLAANEVRLRFSATAFSPLFKDSKNQKLPLKIKSVVMRPRSCLGIELDPEPMSFETTIGMVMTPRVAARITSIKTYRSSRSYKDESRKKVHYFRRDDPNFVEQQFLLPLGARNIRTAYDCEPDPDGPGNPGSYCGWCYPMRVKRGIDCTTEKTSADIVVTCRRKCLGMKATVTHSVRFESPVGTTVVDSYEPDLPLEPGKETSFLLKGGSTGAFDIEGITANGSEFQILSGGKRTRFGVSAALEGVGRNKKRIILSVEGAEPFSSCREAL